MGRAVRWGLGALGAVCVGALVYVALDNAAKESSPSTSPDLQEQTATTARDTSVSTSEVANSDVESVSLLFDQDGVGHIEFTNGSRIPILAIDRGDGRTGWIWSIGSEIEFSSLRLQLEPGTAHTVTEFGDPTTPATGSNVDVSAWVSCANSNIYLATVDEAQISNTLVSVAAVGETPESTTPEIASTEVPLLPRLTGDGTLFCDEPGTESAPGSLEYLADTTWGDHDLAFEESS